MTTEPSIVEFILREPAQILIILHRLTDMAEQDDQAADLMESLHGLLELAGERLLARLAEAYHLILLGQQDRELLSVALRKLVSNLSAPEAGLIHNHEEALAVYRISWQAIEAETVTAVTDLLSTLQTYLSGDTLILLPDLADTFRELVPAVKLLAAYERVDSRPDRLSYLAAAVERLSQVDREVSRLGAADRLIARQIIEKWLSVTVITMRELQTAAKIICHLLTRYSIQEGPMMSLILRLRNQGGGAALNLRIRLVETPEVTLLDMPAKLDRLVSGEETDVEVRVHSSLPLNTAQFRAQFEVTYDDLGRTDQIEHFADVVQLVRHENTFQFIPNPYVVGTPLQTGSPLFFGREDIFSFIEANLSTKHRNNLVLIGQRRMGKSSLLKQFPVRLGDEYVPILLDGQSIALDPGLPAFFYSLATEITFALEDRGLTTEVPDLHSFLATPAHAFEHDFLRRVHQCIGDRHLLLLLDEFEELEAAVRRGSLDKSIFGFIRHLVQHTPNLSMIFCGTHRMEELTTNYWNVLFNICLYKHVGFLSYSEAIHLIQEPVAAFGMRYDDLALDKIWRISAGHPYFLQLLCHCLVNQHNHSERSYVTVADINEATDEILTSGEAHFVYLWVESTREERQVLAALSRILPLTGRVQPAQVSDYLSERSILLDRRTINETLRHLALRDILTAQVGSDGAALTDSYSWQLGLLGLWVEKYKPLSRVMEEEHL